MFKGTLARMYSDASRLPRSLSAVAQSVAAKPEALFVVSLDSFCLELLMLILSESLIHSSVLKTWLAAENGTTTLSRAKGFARCAATRFDRFCPDRCRPRNPSLFLALVSFCEIRLQFPASPKLVLFFQPVTSVTTLANIGPNRLSKRDKPRLCHRSKNAKTLGNIGLSPMSPMSPVKSPPGGERNPTVSALPS